MAPSDGTPKNMSSRLMNMKFMQRAAASERPSPGTPPEPAAKKQRLSYGSYRSTPASTPRSDLDVVADAQAADEEKRAEDSARQAAAHGDSKWYLSLQAPPKSNVSSPLRVVSAGYAALDSGAPGVDHSSEDDVEEKTQPQMAGRRSFGKFNKAVEKQRLDDDASGSDSSSTSGSDEDDDESDDDTGVSAMIAAERRQAGDKARAERAAKKAADRAEAARMAEERRKKEVNLNNITSISGFGGGGTRKLPPADERTCHKCGGKGHLKVQCPQSNDWRRKRGLN